jgi:hypothetical protein
MGSLPLVKVAGVYIKKEEILMSGRLRMQLAFFRRAVRAESTRAFLTVVVGIDAGLVDLLFADRAACRQRAGVPRTRILWDK